jgi:alpha-N-arabinofuranosidase
MHLRRLLGGENSPIPNERGIRLDVVEALRRAHVPNLRGPADASPTSTTGATASVRAMSRPTMVNTNWGTSSRTTFGTHEFMDLCDMLGAEPYVNGNVSERHRAGDERVGRVSHPFRRQPWRALRRANGRDEPWRVPFWGLGNEAWGCRRP